MYMIEVSTGVAGLARELGAGAWAGLAHAFLMLWGTELQYLCLCE